MSIECSVHLQFHANPIQVCAAAELAGAGIALKASTGAVEDVSPRKKTMMKSHLRRSSMAKVYR